MAKKTKNIFKFDRRRAIECKLIGEAKHDKDYWEYEVLVGERDGTTHKEMAYGRDMTDALNRLLWKERVKSIENFVSRKSLNALAGFWVLGVIAPAMLSSYTNSPIPILSVLLFNLVCFLGWKFWYSWVNK
jgi:hypothetical protein